MSEQVRCRAQVSVHCENGRMIDPKLYDAGTWRTDGTYERRTDTVVCDPCYVDLMPLTPSGRGLIPELPAAIERARTKR